MRFSTTALLALAAPLLAYAQTNSSNAFNNPEGGYKGTAGQTLDLTWTPTTTGTVSLILRSGASSALEPGTTIAASIANSGSYSWSIPSDVTRGSDYTVEILDDSDSSSYNFTPYFVIESTNTVASSTGATSSGASSSATSSGSSSSGTSSASSTSGSSSMTGTTSSTRTSATSQTASGAVLTSSSAAAGARATAMAGMLGMAALGAMAL